MDAPVVDRHLQVGDPVGCQYAADGEVMRLLRGQVGIAAGDAGNSCPGLNTLNAEAAKHWLVV